MAKVKIPTPLRRLTGEKDEVETSAGNIINRKFYSLYSQIIY